MSDERWAEPGLRAAVLTEEDQVASSRWRHQVRMIGLAVLAWVIVAVGAVAGATFLVMAFIAPAR